MTDDIAAQLRNLNPWEDPRWPEVLREGADEIERLLLIEQGAAEPCDTCGWRMKFPNEECRNCENAKLRDENERLRALVRDNGTPRFNAICERAEKAEAKIERLLTVLKEIALGDLDGWMMVATANHTLKEEKEDG